MAYQPAVSAPAARRLSHAAALPGLAAGTAVLYLSLIVLIPLAALAWQAQAGGWTEFWSAVRAPDAEGVVADLHQGSFDVDERSIAIGAKFLAGCALLAFDGAR